MEHITRREFLLGSGTGIFCLLANPAFCFTPFEKIAHAASGPSDITGRIFKNDAPDKLWKWSKEAFYYASTGNGRMACGLCPNECVLSAGDRGVCRSRVNMDGRLYSLAYGNVCAANVDPVEKKPLFHFMPETKAFSIAAAGCNFRCLNCQNWEISQAKPESLNHRGLFPEKVVEQAQQYSASSIAYTYSEPVTFYEYMFDTSSLAREKGIRNLLISNGYINPGPLSDLCRVIDGANINLKSFSDDIYRKLNGGRLQPVLDTLENLHQNRVHFEITNLVVPGYTDDPEMFKQMCGWILEKVGADHPLHLLRFFPKYKLNRLPPTPVDLLESFRRTAMDMGSRYVYLGNVPGHEGSHTFCHNCGKTVIERKGYRINTEHMKEGACRSCGEKIPGVWK